MWKTVMDNRLPQMSLRVIKRSRGMIVEHQSVNNSELQEEKKIFVMLSDNFLSK